MEGVSELYKRKFMRKVGQYNHHAQLPEYFKDLIGRKKKVKIAEIGAGPINTIGDSWPNVDVEVFPSDVLANEYDKELWDLHKQTPVVPVLCEDMEALSYPDKMFDIVHCVNALDHTPDLHSALAEIERVCKKGGWVYLRHSYNQKERFGGHHCWDAKLSDGLALFQGEDIDPVILEKYTSYEVDGDRDKLIVSVWKKT
jgi:SAM-dependent methyltransferase